jgi:hypothetical protein
MMMHHAIITLMKAITLSNVPPHVARQIQRKAREDKTSLNRAVTALLDERTTAQGEPPKTPRRDLSFLVEMWSEEEAAAFDANLAEQRKIDPEIWG